MSTQYESHASIDVAPVPDAGNFNFMQKLPSILRILGTAALLVAMYTFLIKGWQNGNDILRYFLMLGHTSILAVIGLASGLWLKENKGARLLLTLALVSIPANFAILGAFIFSSAGPALAQYPDFVAWSTNSLQTTLMTTGIALLFLIPVSLLSFSVLARSISKRLTMLYLVSNAALLIPIRDPMIIGFIVLGLAVVGIVFFHQSLQKHIATKTKEGITALTLLALPLAVLMGRTLWLYSADLFLLFVMVIAIYLFLRQLSVYLGKESLARKSIDLLSLIPAIITMPLLALQLTQAGFMETALILPIAAMASAIMVYDISRRSDDLAIVYRWIAAIILAFGIFVNMYIHASTLASLIAIAAGLGLVIFGYRNKQRGFFIIGASMMIVGIAKQLFHLIYFFDLGSWASLAILGILAIVVGSVIESKGEKIQSRFSQLKDNFRSWEA